MARKLMQGRISSLADVLGSRQLHSGGWAYFGSGQESIEATCLAALALGHEAQANYTAAVSFLLKSQLKDGSWPAFLGDSEGNWATALAVCAMNTTGDLAAACEKAVRWLECERGREGRWLWRLKFKTVDRSVRFDPDKYGWPWIPETASWVIPTALSIVALKQFTSCNRSEASEQRIQLGVEMLLDRACVGGGWNAGNSVVYGVPLTPHVEATAIALLALQDQPRSQVIRAGFDWLHERSATIRSAESLAWCILSLFVFQQPVERLKEALVMALGASSAIENTATLAAVILALRCGEMIHPFVVLR
jgi:hypothetical protein